MKLSVTKKSLAVYLTNSHFFKTLIIFLEPAIKLNTGIFDFQN